MYFMPLNFTLNGNKVGHFMFWLFPPHPKVYISEKAWYFSKLLLHTKSYSYAVRGEGAGPTGKGTV